MTQGDTPAPRFVCPTMRLRPPRSPTPSTYVRGRGSLLGNDAFDDEGGEFPELTPTHIREHFGIQAPNKHFDTMLQGRGSYQVVLDAGLTRPYAHMREYVFSSTLPHDVDPHVSVVAGDPVATVRELKQEKSALDICLVGGPTIAGALLPEIDTLLLKRYPVVAGAGKPVFQGAFTPTAFERTQSVAFDSGADYTFFTRADGS